MIREEVIILELMVKWQSSDGEQASPLKCLLYEDCYQHSLRRGLGGERGKWEWRHFPSLFPVPSKPIYLHFTIFQGPEWQSVREKFHRVAMSQKLMLNNCPHRNIKDLCNLSERKGLGQPNICLLYDFTITFSERKRQLMYLYQENVNWSLRLYHLLTIVLTILFPTEGI